MSGIFDEMISLDNLLAAWREFRRGKSDRADVADFSRHLEDNLFALHEELTVGTYRPGAYHRFRISDPKPRVIHKAEVRDRVVHHAFCRVAAPIFERSFIHDSYSCRIGKGTHAAVRRLEDFARQASDNYRYGCWALKFDIRKFFDSVDHALLLGIVGQKLGYGKATALARRIVGSFAKKSSGGGFHGSVGRKGCRSVI
jgi:RNA-directed DNA polymerase